MKLYMYNRNPLAQYQSAFEKVLLAQGNKEKKSVQEFFISAETNLEI